MSFGTFNTTLLNKPFLAGLIFVSASALGAAEARGDNSTLRYLEGQLAPYAVVEGVFRNIRGYAFSNAIGMHSLNQIPFNSSDYIANALFVGGQDSEVAATATDSAQRLGKALGDAEAATETTSLLYRESLVKARSNAVAQAYNRSDGTYLLATNVVYAKGYATGLSHMRLIADGFAGRGAAVVGASATGTARRWQFLESASLAEAENATVANLIRAYQAGVIGSAETCASPDVTRGGVRYAYAQGDGVASATGLDNAIRKAKAYAEADAEALAVSEPFKTNTFRFVGSKNVVATAEFGVSLLRRYRLASADTQGQADAAGALVRHTKPTADTVSGAVAADTAQRLGKPESTSLSEAVVADFATRLGNATGSLIGEVGSEDSALRLGVAQSNTAVEAQLSRPDPQRYANVFGVTASSAESQDTAQRLGKGSGEQEAHAALVDAAERLGKSTGSVLVAGGLADAAQRLGKANKSTTVTPIATLNTNTINYSPLLGGLTRPQAYAVGESKADSIRYGNGFANAEVEAEAADSAQRLGKGSGEQEAHAALVDAAERLGKSTGSMLVAGGLADAAQRLGKVGGDVGVSAATAMTVVRYAKSTGAAISEASTIDAGQRLGKPTGRARANVSTSDEALRTAYTFGAPTVVAAEASGKVTKIVQFNPPQVISAGSYINDLVLNAAPLVGGAVRPSLHSIARTYGLPRLNTQMVGHAPHIFVVAADDCEMIIEQDDWEYVI